MSPRTLPSPQRRRIALVGDTHANAPWTGRVIAALAAHGIDMVVQLGDFGWWPHIEFARKISHAARFAGITVCFIDGNHEHHDHLRFHSDLRNRGGNPTDPVEMYQSLWYLPRGCSWQWHGVRFRALGGAFSIDHASRTAGYNWFPGAETPSFADAERAIAGGPADVLLCHDYPAVGYLLTGLPIPAADQRASRQVQTMLAAVVERIEPKLVVHGHWHRRYTTVRDGLTIAGLDRDNTHRAVALLDLDTLQIEDRPPPDAPQQAHTAD